MPQSLPSFTIKYEGIARELTSDIQVDQSCNKNDVFFDIKAPKFSAIWDTGATQSVITQNVVDTCDLTPVGMTRAHTVNGIMDTEVYLISLLLPNNLVIPEIAVTRGDLGTEDMLIGMDIISLGDFAITNKNGKTRFSFRMPSYQRFDFVNHCPSDKQACTCGSGKMFKNCCKKKPPFPLK